MQLESYQLLLAVAVADTVLLIELAQSQWLMLGSNQMAILVTAVFTVIDQARRQFSIDNLHRLLQGLP